MLQPVPNPLGIGGNSLLKFTAYSPWLQYKCDTFWLVKYFPHNNNIFLFILFLFITIELLCPTDNLDGLHAYLDILNQGSDSVSEWIIGGKIYLDYITLHDVVSDIKQVM